MFEIEKIIRLAAVNGGGQACTCPCVRRDNQNAKMSF